MTPQESLQFSTSFNICRLAAGEKACPVCSRETQDEYVPLLVLEEELQKLIRANAPDTQRFEAICARCVRLFERAKDQIIQRRRLAKRRFAGAFDTASARCRRAFYRARRDDRVSRFGILSGTLI